MSEREISLTEVKEHNKEDDVWIVIHNNVYDVTEFLNEHPAGPEILIEHAGKDGTKDFDDAGHSDDAKKLMLKYKIGKVAKQDIPSSCPSRLICHVAIATAVGLLLGVLVKRRFYSS